jgi:hypothetical protein
MPKTGVFPERSGSTASKVPRTFLKAKGRSAGERPAIGQLASGRRAAQPR